MVDSQWIWAIMPLSTQGDHAMNNDFIDVDSLYEARWERDETWDSFDSDFEVRDDGEPDEDQELEDFLK